MTSGRYQWSPPSPQKCKLGHLVKNVMLHTEHTYVQEITKSVQQRSNSSNVLCMYQGRGGYIVTYLEGSDWVYYSDMITFSLCTYFVVQRFASVPKILQSPVYVHTQRESERVAHAHLEEGS